MIKKSAKQREHEDRRNRQDRHPTAGAVPWAGDDSTTGDDAVPVGDEVRVYEGDPFNPAGTVDTVAEKSFAKPPPEPPFKLTGKQYRELTERLRPRIAFPKEEPCPITKGEVYPVTSKLSFVVTGITETKTEWELHYTLLDDRAHTLGKLSGYVDGGRGAIATRKGIEGEGERLGGPEFSPETEPEAVAEEERGLIAAESKDETLTRLQQNRVKLQADHDRMQREGLPSTVLWGIRRSIAQLDQRITYLKHEIAEQRPEKEAA